MPVRGVASIDQMVGQDDEDTKLLRVMAAGAEKYLRSFPWCKSVREVYFGDGYGGVAAVFLFHIEPSKEGVDEWLWVISCDVSPAYLVTDSCKIPSQALSAYVEEVSKWVQLARLGRSSNDVIPVYMPATPQNAASVEDRLKILTTVIVPAFQAAEVERA